MHSQRGGSRTDTLIKLVLIFFISLLSFSVGTYVGKQVSDSDHRRAKIEGEYDAVASHKDEATEGENVDRGNQEKLSEEDIANLTEEFVSPEKEAAKTEAGTSEEGANREVASEGHEAPAGYKKYSPEKAKHGETEPAAEKSDAHGGHAEAAVKPAAHSELGEATAKPKAHGEHAEPAAKPAAHDEHPAKPEAHGEHAAAESHPAPAATRVAEGHAPSADPKEVRKPQSVLPSVASTAVGKFTVQVASFPDETEAKNRAAELKAKGWNAFYIPAAVQGKTWYRVSVGLFTTAKSATDFRTEFLKEAKVTTAIVQKIVQ